MNVHNYLAFSVPFLYLALAQKISAQLQTCNTRMVQMDKSCVIVIGELLYVFIRL